MRVLPTWAKAPKHKKKVVATDKGWVVEESGEVLVSHKNLDQKIKALFSEIETLEKPEIAEREVEEKVVETESSIEQVEQPKEPEQDEKPATEDEGKEEKGEDEKAEVKKEEEPKPTKKKRRGRPPKKK